MMFLIRRSFEHVVSQQGQGVVEYGLIVALISLAAVVTLTPIGTNIIAILTKIVAAF